MAYIAKFIYSWTLAAWQAGQLSTLEWKYYIFNLFTAVALQYPIFYCSVSTINPDSMYGNHPCFNYCNKTFNSINGECTNRNHIFYNFS
jgi:hypothetical protein